MNVQKEVIRIISLISDVDEKDIKEDDSIKNLGIDSLKAVELIIAFEDELNIVFEDSDLDPREFNEVSNIIALIEKYVINNTVI